VQGLPSSQLAHAAPAAPQSVPVSEASATQVLLFMHPVQQTPLAQTPPVHAVPLETFVCPHAPAALHVSVVQALLSSQLTHSAPAAPHFVTVSEASAVHVPAVSVPQPVVQHALFSQRPEPHAAPFVTVVPAHTALPHTSLDVQRLPSSHPVVAFACWQPPATHWSVVHGLPSSHDADVPQFAHLSVAVLQKALTHWD
jgi:hypothetical protein